MLTFPVLSNSIPNYPYTILLYSISTFPIINNSIPILLLFILNIQFQVPNNSYPFSILLLVTGFSYFQYYCFVSGSVNIPSFASGLTNTSVVIDFLNTSESFAAAGCQFTNPLRDFFASNAPWYEYQMETWLVLGK